MTTLDRWRPAGSSSDGSDTDVTRADRDTERLFDIERLERSPLGDYCRIVDDLAADIGASVDWDSTTLSAPDLGDHVPVWRVGALADPAAPHPNAARGVGGGADPPNDGHP